MQSFLIILYLNIHFSVNINTDRRHTLPEKEPPKQREPTSFDKYMAFDLHRLHICTTVETILTTHWSQVCSHLKKKQEKSANAKIKAIMTNGLLH